MSTKRVGDFALTHHELGMKRQPLTKQKDEQKITRVKLVIITFFQRKIHDLVMASNY